MENCDHDYTPNYLDIWKPPYCEKCGKPMPYEDME